MRYVVMAISTALLVGLFSACMESDSGSTGLSCTGPGAAIKKFGTVAECAAFPDGADGFCLVVPQTFNLTIGGGEGSAFCTAPGTPAIFEIATRATSDLIVPAGPCAGTIPYQFSYTYIFRGNDIAPVPSVGFPGLAIAGGPKGTFSLSTPGVIESQAATAQFCFDTNLSGHYRFLATDGSSQTGTWYLD